MTLSRTPQTAKLLNVPGLFRRAWVSVVVSTPKCSVREEMPAALELLL